MQHGCGGKVHATPLTPLLSGFLNCTNEALPDSQWKETLKHLTVGFRGFQQMPLAAKLLETTAPLLPRKLPEGTHFLTFVRQPTPREREQLQQLL